MIGLKKSCKSNDNYKYILLGINSFNLYFKAAKIVKLSQNLNYSAIN